MDGQEVGCFPDDVFSFNFSFDVRSMHYDLDAMSTTSRIPDFQLWPAFLAIFSQAMSSERVLLLEAPPKHYANVWSLGGRGSRR